MDPLNTLFIQLLRQSGWTQAEAARRLHLTPSTISLYLSGSTRPSPTVLQLFKLMLGDLTPLPGKRQPRGQVPVPPLFPLDEAETALLRQLRAIAEPARGRLLGAFQELAALVPVQPAAASKPERR